MKLDDKGRTFLKLREGLSLVSYKDGGGVWTIGYGHTRDVKPGMRITAHQAEVIFDSDVEEYEECVSFHCKSVTQNQFNALVSLCYNIGTTRFAGSTIVKILRKHGPFAAAPHFLSWIYDNGQIVKGLITRRAHDLTLFLTPDAT